MAINRQPVFTDIPILVSKTINPPVLFDNCYDISTVPPTTVFTSADVSGSLIERITVAATADTGNGSRNVTAKTIYLAIYDSNESDWSLYKTAAMPGAVSLDGTQANPEVEWIFTGGILLPYNFQLGIAASANYSTANYYGDYVAVTVEGSSYTSVQ